MMSTIDAVLKKIPGLPVVPLAAQLEESGLLVDTWTDTGELLDDEELLYEPPPQATSKPQASADAASARWRTEADRRQADPIERQCANTIPTPEAEQAAKRPMCDSGITGPG